MERDDKLFAKISSYKDFYNYWNNLLSEPNIKSEVWKSIASGYFEYETKLISTNNFISNIYLFPKITMEIINIFKKSRSSDGIADRLSKEYRLEVSIFSTMLPRHFYNFPHKIEMSSDNNVSQNKVLLYSEDYVENYRTAIKNIILDNSSNSDLKINRYTLLAFNKTIINKLTKLAPIYYNNNIFTLNDFLDDYKTIPFEKETLSSVHKLGDCEISCGLEEEELGKLFEKYGHIEDYELTYFKKYKGEFPVDSILCRFISNLHSPKSGYIVIISDDKTVPKNKQLKDIISREIIQEDIVDYSSFNGINPDFIKFKLIPKKTNGKTASNKSYEFYLTARINLESDTVVLSVFCEESIDTEKKDLFDKYDKVYKLLDSKAIPLNYDLGSTKNIRNYVNERLGNDNNDDDYKNFLMKYDKYEKKNNLQALVIEFFKDDIHNMNSREFRSFIKRL